MTHDNDWKSTPGNDWKSTPGNEWKAFRSDDPRYHDPRFQRRVVRYYRPIEMVENMYDVTLSCGHAPLFFGDKPPEVGELCFCPNCCEPELLG